LCGREIAGLEILAELLDLLLVRRAGAAKAGFEGKCWLKSRRLTLMYLDVKV
jgi:hypothetical protein